MWRPSSEFRLPSWLSVAIAVGLGSVGIWCGRRGLAALDGSAGFEGLVGAVLLLFAGGAFVLSTVALMLARSAVVFWIGLIAFFIIYVATTQPSHQRTSSSPEADCEWRSSADGCQAIVALGERFESP